MDVKRWLLVFAVVLLIGACASDGSPINSNGRITGHALAGPTCPVEQPGDLNCQPKPVQGNVQFVQGDNVISSTPIDEVGNFSIEISAGTYTVTVDTGDNIFPTCPPVEVEVRADAESVVEVFCDTGIR